MKISVITIHRVYNFGSVLQAFATQKIFESKGCEVEVIDYISSIRTAKHLILGDKGISPIYRIGRTMSIILKELTIGRFIKKRINLSCRYITENDLDSNPPKADIYITGSDQTWNSQYNEGLDRGYFLDFIDNNADRVAFVSSFGKTKLEDYEVEATKQYLSRYRLISVREDSAVSILEEMNIPAVQLIDPTLQIRKKDWVSIASKRLIKQKYLILMLLYQEDNNATDYARKIADEKGLRLVKISWELRKDPRIDKLMTHRTPEDFLSLFYYADFVVTNSFHGLAFSINLEKPFIVIPRNEYNSRIESLLKLCNLQNRMVCTEKQALDASKRDIDYKSVRGVLEVERKRADKFVNEILEKRNEDSM